jgi:hypothetical protein
VTGTRADQYAVTWASVNLGPHRDHGGWRHIQGGPVCNCGATLAEPEGEAA